LRRSPKKSPLTTKTLGGGKDEAEGGEDEGEGEGRTRTSPAAVFTGAGASPERDEGRAGTGNPRPRLTRELRDRPTFITRLNASMRAWSASRRRSSK